MSGEASACMQMNIYACADEAVSVSECCVCDLSVAAQFLSFTYGVAYEKKEHVRKMEVDTHSPPSALAIVCV